MTPAKILLTFIDRPTCWPTAARADLFARYQRSIGQPMRHWIITRDGGLTAADCAHLGVRTAGLQTFDDYADSAQVMADRLLMKGHAYDAEGRVYLPWAGGPGYAPPQRAHGRRGPCDIQLWGPHWADGPVGPSATLVQWAAIHEHASGPADWVFGYNAQAAMRLQAVAQAMSGQPAAAVVRPPLIVAPRLRAMYPSAWDGRAARWSALQCKQALAPAQSRYGMRMSQAARLAEVRGDAPPNPGHVQLIENAQRALDRFDWRDANQWLLGLCKTVNRMQTSHIGTRDAPSPRMRTRIVSLIDALGL